MFLSFGLDYIGDRSERSVMEHAHTIEFWIDRRGDLVADGSAIGSFATVEAAADFAIRFAQDLGGPYRIFYPL